MESGEHIEEADLIEYCRIPNSQALNVVKVIEDHLALCAECTHRMVAKVTENAQMQKTPVTLQ